MTTKHYTQMSNQEFKEYLRQQSEEIIALALFTAELKVLVKDLENLQTVHQAEDIANGTK